MHVVIERGRVVPFAELPPESLALDGYVQGPEIDLETRRFSFDHHDRCLRMVTRATCQQVMDALLLGLDVSGMRVFLNDVDADTALAVWLLAEPGRARDPAIRRLVESVGAVDAHGPAYPALDPELAEAFLVVAMAAEHEARRCGAYPGCDLEALLAECLAGIDAFVAGGMTARAPRPEDPWTLTHEGTGWVMVETRGFVFRHLYARGHDRIVSWRALGDGTWAYSLGRKSDLVTGFPVGPASVEGTLLHALAAREPGWGGGSSVGGSPRGADGSSSRLSPDEVFALVEAVLAGR